MGEDCQLIFREAVLACAAALSCCVIQHTPLCSVVLSPPLPYATSWGTLEGSWGRGNKVVGSHGKHIWFQVWEINLIFYENQRNHILE